MPPISLLSMKNHSKKFSPIKHSHLKTFVYVAMAKQAKNYNLFFKIIVYEKQFRKRGQS